MWEQQSAGQVPRRNDDFSQIVDRAARDYERWAEQVQHTGYCARPVRLVGRTEQLDRATGEVRETYSTEGEPEDSLLIACGNRRESRCPNCAARYRQDAFQLVAAGLRGGKGVPESVSEHPMLFVTLTAPSFGPVHACRSTGKAAHPCRPRRSGKCRHGIPMACWQRHDQDDPRVGQPLCPTCFDYDGQVLWNALAPELWRRTTIYVRRALAKQAGLTVATLQRTVRLSYVKVAEYQRRGALHFHAVVRLDGVCGDASYVFPPPEGFTAEVLEQAIREGVDRVFAPLPIDHEEEVRLLARWGDQLEVRQIHSGSTALSSQAVAAYIAKYATKSSEDLGCGDLGALDARADTDRHLVMLTRAAQRLGERLSLRHLRLSECAHALGFKGHWSTKSRRYSTTFTSLRRARRDYARRSRCKGGVPLDAWGRDEDEDKVQTRAAWRHAGSGYRNSGEAWLASCAAARAREHRRLAREELSSQLFKKG